ncbi:MAG: hypothetical protein EOP51_15730 [Sphingobacteriales bacterium]|nr:MAG: hypothetical protein EOP51_15730 [Sphingobacteriales bacterium]
MRDSILSIQTGKYIVTGIHGDCAYTDTVDVFIRSSPTTPHILLNNSPICAGDTLIVFAPTSGFSAPTYYLNPNNDVLLFTYIDTLILPNMQPNMAGIYGVYTSGIQGCYSDTVHFNVQVDSCTLNATNVSETQPFIPTLLQSQDAVFKPTFTTNPRDFHMLILDATGRKVFETKNLSGWNRESYRGIFYYYIQITIGSKIAIYKGKLITL